MFVVFCSIGIIWLEVLRPRIIAFPEAKTRAVALYGSSILKIPPPEYGCYVGVFPGWGEFEDSVSAQQLKDFEELSGKSVAIFPFSNFWGENCVSSQQLDEIASYGAVPLLRMMPWGEPYWELGYQPDYAVQKVIDGDFDQFLSDWADEIKDFGRPVMVTFGCEMNGDWFPWSGVFQGGSTTTDFGDPKKADGPERYVAAYRHIIELFRNEGVNNVTWIFHPNARSYPEEDWNSIHAYYPGDEYVDWVGISLYGTQYVDEHWHGFEALMDPVYNELTSLFPNKPLMLSEWGVGEWPDKGDKAAWYTEALTKLQSNYSLIKAAIVYHEKWQNDDGTWSDLRINSSPEALKAYRDSISLDYFIGKIGPSSSKEPLSLSQIKYWAYLICPILPPFLTQVHQKIDRKNSGF